MPNKIVTARKDFLLEQLVLVDGQPSGITNLTLLMASYYGQFNIRVNTLVPGTLSGYLAGKSDKQNLIFVKKFSKKVPLKSLGFAEEIAATELFLASDAASYITGATIMVDGGWTSV